MGRYRRCVDLRLLENLPHMPSRFMLFADWSAQFLPQLSPGAALGLLVGVPLGVLALARLLGPANTVSRRWSLWSLRGAILLIVVVVLFNPVRVDELPDQVQRPEIFYLLDTSASMQMGSPLSRWDESLRLIEQARRLVVGH